MLFALLGLWLLCGLTTFAIVKLLPGIHVDDTSTAIKFAVIFTIVYTFLSPFLAFYAFYLFFTIGYYILLLLILFNAFLLWVIEKFVHGIEIEGIFTLFLAAFIITLSTTLLGGLIS